MAQQRKEARKRRHLRVRRKISGDANRPRLNVYRSLNHIYAQVIDDLSGHTLVYASSLEPALKDELQKTGNKDAARAVGEMIAKRALEKGIDTVVFDRGGYLYHGRIKALADGVRSQGLTL